MTDHYRLDKEALLAGAFLLLAYSGSYIALLMVFMAQGTPVEFILNYKATPHNGDCGLRRIFCPNHAV